MPDDKTRAPGSITRSADSQDERISGISNVSRTVTQMQKTTQRQIDETRDSIDYGASPDMAMKQMNGILSRFGRTIGAFTKGIEDVTLSTAKATKDAIGQYSRVISQDINYNKQNIVAMALARTTPLFGYFAAKFMETDVFKKAKDKMSESIAGVFKSVGSSIANIFRGKEKAHSDAVPKMQRGGYVKKGGMVEVHPAEVVMPIEKILERIDESISVAKEITDITQKTQIRSLAKMGTFVEAERNKEPVGMVKGFLRAMREVHSQYEEPSNVRLLRAVLSIQDTMGATIGTWEQVWTKILVEHPTFRQIAFTMKTMGTVFSALPRVVGVFFKRRGSYQAHLSKAKNPFERMSDNIGSLYTGTMWRLDNLWKISKINAQANRDVATFLTGNKYPAIEGVGLGFWSFFGWMRSGIRLLSKPFELLVKPFELLANKSKFTKWLNTDVSGPVISLAEKISDKIFTHRAELKGIHGGEYETESGVGIVGALLSEFARRQRSGKNPPLQISYTPELQNQWEEVSQEMKETKEGVWESADSLDKANKREKRKGIMGFFSMIGGGIGSLFSGAGGFLKNLLGLGTGGWLSSSIAALFSKSGAITSALMATLGSSWFWGPIIAGLVGAGIGTAINKGIIEPYIIEPWLKRVDEANKKAHQEAVARNQKLISDARGKTATGAETYQARVAAGAGKMVTQQETLIGTSLDAVAIANAQRRYIEQNKEAYSKYDLDEIEKARTRWKHSIGYLAYYKWKSQAGDPDKFGMEKESSFLKYLKNVGTPMTAAQMEAKVGAHEKMIYQAGNVLQDANYFVRKYGPKAQDWIAEKGKWAINKAGQIVDKATGKIMDAKDIAAMQTSDLMASAQLLQQELKARGMEGLEGMKEMGDKVAGQLNQVSNVIHQQSSNVTRIFNSGLGKAGDMFDEMKHKVVTGNFH